MEEKPQISHTKLKRKRMVRDESQMMNVKKW